MLQDRCSNKASTQSRKVDDDSKNLVTKTQFLHSNTYIKRILEIQSLTTTRRK